MFPDSEDSWKVSLVQEQLLILKYLHDEMQGRVKISQAFSSIRRGCILEDVLLRIWGMMICNLQNRSPDSIQTAIFIFFSYSFVERLIGTVHANDLLLMAYSEQHFMLILGLEHLQTNC